MLKYTLMSYHQEETAILLESAQESQEGDTSDDNATDQQHVCRGEVGQARSQCSHLKVHQHVNTETQHGHATHLIRNKNSLS